VSCSNDCTTTEHYTILLQESSSIVWCSIHNTNTQYYYWRAVLTILNHSSNVDKRSLRDTLNSFFHDYQHINIVLIQEVFHSKKENDKQQN